MTRTITTKATVEQTHALGNYMFSQGYSPEQVLAWLKAKKYNVRNVRFNGAYVANYVAGAQAIIASVTAGQATCTKAKGYVVKPAKAVEPVVAKVETAPAEPAEEEAPF